ncbi:MAG: type II toxin-antitoxin system RelE/ParE family toxin [Methylocella sp.]
MKVEFTDDDLAQICTDQAYRLGLPVAVIRSARNRLIQLEAARDERDLRNLKGLHYKKGKGERANERSVRINDQYRIVFVLSEEENPPIIRIIKIGDTH